MCVGYYLMYLLDEISYTVLDMLDNKGLRVQLLEEKSPRLHCQALGRYPT